MMGLLWYCDDDDEVFSPPPPVFLPVGHHLDQFASPGLLPLLQVLEF